MRAGESMIVFDSVARSNMQPEEKSQIRRWAEKMMGPISEIRPKDAPGGLLSAVRQSSEGLFTGGMLALGHVYGDKGLSMFGLPVDGVGGTALVGISAFMGHSEFATEARNIGSHAQTVWAFRTLSDLLIEHRVKKGDVLPRHLTRSANISGEVDDDPVVRAASNLL